MKIIFCLTMFMMIPSTFAYEKKVIVGNPESKNSIQINRFYIINKPITLLSQKNTIKNNQYKRKYVTFQNEDDEIYTEEESIKK